MRQPMPRTSLSAWVSGVALVVSALVSLCAWALASPTNSSPDDNFHLPSIWCAQGESELCQATEDPSVRRVPFPVVAGSCFAPDVTASAACQDQYPEELVADITVDHGNWNGGYPPLFYAAMSVFAGDQLAPSVLAMRLASVVLVVGLLAGLCVLLPRRLRPLAVVPMVVTTVPVGLFFLASTNPTSWALTSAAVVWPALYAAYESTGVRRWLLLALTLLGAVLGAGARSDASLFTVLAVVLVLLLRLPLLRRDVAATGIALVSIAISAYFFFSSGQAGVVTAGIGTTAHMGIPWPTLLRLNTLDLPTLLAGNWGLGVMGGTGWLDTRFAPLVGILGVCVWAGLVFGWCRDLSRAKAVAVAVSGAAVVAYPLIVLGRSGITVGHGFQPRYALPLIIVFTGLCLVPARGRRQPLSRAQLGVAVAALALANTIALQVQLRRYVTGADVADLSLDRGREWWWDAPFGPNALWIAGSVAFAVTAFLALRLLRDDLTPESTRPPEASPTVRP